MKQRSDKSRSVRHRARTARQKENNADPQNQKRIAGKIGSPKRIFKELFQKNLILRLASKTYSDKYHSGNQSR